MKLDNFTLDQVTSLKLPPYQILKDIKFWMTAPDNSFKADGIEEGDLLGIFWPEFVEYFSTDEPRDIYVVLPIGQEPTLRLAKYDFTVEDDFTKVIFDSEGKETLIMDLNEPLRVHDVGLVKVVLKNKAF